MKKSKALVLFDVGGVLLELNYSKLYEAGAKLTQTTPAEFKQRYLDSRLELDVLNGDISDEQYQQELKNMLENPQMSRAELEDFVKNSWGKEITPVVDLKQRIYFEGDCLVNIFSNLDRFGFEYLSRTHPRMMQTFRPDAVPICSYSSKGTKPKSLNMYRDGVSSAEKLGCNRVILIDDKESVLKIGIDQFGWYGIHFTPYIDPNEAIRIHSPAETLFTSDKLFVTNSVGELEQALTGFGINLSN
jgi:FMN phosphatase YigB (HAD superfamily)